MTTFAQVLSGLYFKGFHNWLGHSKGRQMFINNGWRRKDKFLAWICVYKIKELLRLLKLISHIVSIWYMFIFNIISYFKHQGYLFYIIKSGKKLHVLHFMTSVQHNKA